jgi:hypothetical protein
MSIRVPDQPQSGRKLKKIACCGEIVFDIHENRWKTEKCLTFLPAVVDYTHMNRLSDILNRKYWNFSKIVKIRDMWTEIAGEVLAAHTEPVQLKGKTLAVICDSPAWVQQMGVLGPALVEKVHKVARIKIEKVDARFSAHSRPAQKRAASRRRVMKLNIDPEDVKRIKDPKLRKVVMQLID